jgi:hypothetical protein
MRPPNAADAWLGASITFSNAAGSFADPDRFSAPPRAGIMIGLCMGVELDLRNRSWVGNRQKEPTTQDKTLSKRPTEGPRKKARFSHTLCTCGADASLAAGGYLIGGEAILCPMRCLHWSIGRRQPFAKFTESRDPPTAFACWCAYTAGVADQRQWLHTLLCFTGSSGRRCSKALSILLVLQVAELHPDARHSGGLIQGSEYLC